MVMYMNNKIKETVDFYVLCNKLKDTIRVGWGIWNIKRDRVESVADHIYGTQMLAIAIYYQFKYDLDLRKILYMLAIHELEEIVIGDLVFSSIKRHYEIKDFSNLIPGHGGILDRLDSILFSTITVAIYTCIFLLNKDGGFILP